MVWRLDDDVVNGYCFLFLIFIFMNVDKCGVKDGEEGRR